LRNSHFSRAEIDSTLTALRKASRVVIRGEIAADTRSWRALRAQVIAAIERAHETKSEQKGLELTEVRAALKDRPAEVTEALIDDLCADGFARRGSVIAKITHCPQLPAGLQSSAERILKTLQEKPLDPPARSRIVLNAADQQALRYLVEQERAIELEPDLILSGDAFALAKQIVSQVVSASGSATVSELREALHTSRRVAVPLLERLDRDRITRRIGDRRVLVQTQTTAT
jgi:selenocysteine-specific elongation factor